MFIYTFLFARFFFKHCDLLNRTRVRRDLTLPIRSDRLREPCSILDMSGQGRIQESFGKRVRKRIVYVLDALSLTFVIFVFVNFHIASSSPLDLLNIAHNRYVQIGFAFMYWIHLIFWLSVYLVSFFDLTPRSLNLVHFSSTLSVFMWISLVAHKHYLLSELITVLWFGLLLAAFWSRRNHSIKLGGTRTVANRIIVMPLLWTIYAVWWNGAVLADSCGASEPIVALLFTFGFVAAIPVIMRFGDDFTLLTNNYSSASSIDKFSKSIELETNVAPSLASSES